MRVKVAFAVEQIEQLMMLRILSGEFTGRDTLPTRRELAEEYGVCENTIGAAMRGLSGRGLCTTRFGVGLVPIPLAHALDHRLLLELIKQADDVVHAMKLLQQVLVLVRQLLTDAASQAATRRVESHLRAFREVLDEALLSGEGQPESTATAVQEYELWRIVAGASGSLSMTATLNSLRALWLDPALLRGARYGPQLSTLRDVVTSIESRSTADAEAAASRLLVAREAHVEAISRSAEARPNTLAS